ncbi:small ribosomal subunit protein uS12m [Planococcus citri]|uniref:small ribosomal subunit protein uS12m n=1 Tax=Planococcus citri TaxID=170843 RepID=UPI0031F76CF9
MSLFRSCVNLICRQEIFGQFLKNSKPANASILGDAIIRLGSTLERLHKTGPVMKNRPNKNPLGYNKPFMKGIVLRRVVKKPVKPNSGNRQCVLLRLSNGEEVTAHVPGEGHNLQEHNVVLVRPGRTKDVPGLKLKCVRGKYDLPHVIKKIV